MTVLPRRVALSAWTRASSASGKRAPMSSFTVPASTWAAMSVSCLASLRTCMLTVRTDDLLAGVDDAAGQVDAGDQRQLDGHDLLQVPGPDARVDRVERGAGHLDQHLAGTGDGLVYSRSGLTYQAAQLEKQELVTRTPGEDDERSVQVTLTPAGRALLEKVLPGHVEVVQRLMMSSLSPADIATITEILGRVRDNMRSAPPRSAAPRAPRPRG
jgi:DNA-binding MarR family transcriptional regulator